MTKHRRTRRYRKAAVAAFAVGAVAVPSAAMACINEPGQAGDGHQGHWQNAAYRHHHWSGKSDGSGKPAAGAAKAAAASPSKSTAKASASASGDTAQVVKLVNDERGKAGCAPLKVNAELTKAAQDHSKDMAGHKNMSHTGSDGSSPGDRITRAGYSWGAYGENVAYGYSSPESVMKGWMNSPGHKRNILDCSFKEIGVGHAQPGDYWTQDFGTAR
ncbi:CAP domain-containing protein [Streptomyces kronopolitis]|uniref:CAP domain-containing protein n=1 Tax=Streptomyces kronopolitis TaxID=1612435 RepID=UPI0036C55BA6